MICNPSVPYSAELNLAPIFNLPPPRSPQVLSLLLLSRHIPRMGLSRPCTAAGMGWDVCAHTSVGGWTRNGNTDTDGDSSQESDTGVADPVPAEVPLQLPPAHTGQQLPAGPLQPPRALVTHVRARSVPGGGHRGVKCSCTNSRSHQQPGAALTAGTGAGGTTGTAGRNGTDTTGDAECPKDGGTGGGKHQMGTIELIKEKHKGREGTCSINTPYGNERDSCTEALRLHRSMTKNHCDIARKTNSILRMSPCKKHSLPGEGNTCSW